MILHGKAVNLPQLEAELAAADIEVRALGTAGDDLHTYDEDGAAIDLPAEAAAVVAAHEPEPPPPSDFDMTIGLIGTIDFGGQQALEELGLGVQMLAAVVQQKLEG